MQAPVVYVWESYPEYKSTQQLARCLGRIFASLPKRLRRRLQRPMTRIAVMIANGIAGAHAEVHDDGSYTRAHREEMQSCGLEAIRLCRDMLVIMKEEKQGDRANVLASFELLERIEDGLKNRPLPD